MTDTNGKDGQERSDGVVIDHDPNERPRAPEKRSLSSKVGLALAALIGVGAVAHAASGPERHHWRAGWDSGWSAGWREHRAGRRMHAMLDDVGASPAQQQQIRAAFEKAWSQTPSIGRQVYETRAELAALLSASTVDSAALEQMRAARINAVDGASKAWLTAVTEAAKVLTADQRTKLADALSYDRSRW